MTPASTSTRAHPQPQHRQRQLHRQLHQHQSVRRDVPGFQPRQERHPVKSCNIQSYTGANARWLLRIGNGTTETGTNKAPTSTSSALPTRGVSIDAPFTILRSNGRVQVAFDGPSKPTAGQWAATSDRRIKRSIRPYDKGLDEILKLHPVSYKFKPETGRDPDKRHVSMIAQEVEAVMPEMISKDDETLGEFHFTDMRTFDPTNIQYALINAVKTLDARLSALEERI